MIKPGSDVLFQEPTCETRRLRRSVVVDVSPDDFSIQFVAEPFDFTLEQEVLMYFNGKSEFMQQIGRIKEIIQPGAASDTSEAGEGEQQDAAAAPAAEDAGGAASMAGAVTFTIEPVGDAISAENRQTYRVSTISADVEATVGKEDVQVQDLSATGFAVVASTDYQLGQTIDVEIQYEEEQCHGVASVQSLRNLGPGRIRYGLRAIEEDPHTGVFLQTLQRISLAVQREQLKRSGF